MSSFRNIFFFLLNYFVYSWLIHIILSNPFPLLANFVIFFYDTYLQSVSPLPHLFVAVLYSSSFSFFFFCSLSSAPPPYLCRHLFFCCCLPFHCLPAAEQMKQQYNDGFGCWMVAQLLFYIAIHSSICICFCCSFFFAATAETPLVPQRIQVP